MSQLADDLHFYLNIVETSLLFCRFSVYVHKNTMYFEKHIQYVSGISTFVAVNGYIHCNVENLGVQNSHCLMSRGLNVQSIAI